MRARGPNSHGDREALTAAWGWGGDAPDQAHAGVEGGPARNPTPAAQARIGTGDVARFAPLGATPARAPELGEAWRRASAARTAGVREAARTQRGVASPVLPPPCQAPHAAPGGDFLVGHTEGECPQVPRTAIARPHQDRYPPAPAFHSPGCAKGFHEKSGRMGNLGLFANASTATAHVQTRGAGSEVRGDRKKGLTSRLASMRFCQEPS